MKKIKYKIFFLSLMAAFLAWAVNVLLKHTFFSSIQKTTAPVKDITFISIVIILFVIYGYILKFFFLKYYLKERQNRKNHDSLEDTELLSTLEDVAGIGRWIIDMEHGGKFKWSKGVYDILEIEEGQPLTRYQDHINWYMPEYRDMVREKIERSIQTGQTVDFEAMLKTKTGKTKWCRTIGKSVKKDGKLIKLAGVFQDISGQKESYKKIKASEERYCSVLDLITVIIWTADHEGCFCERQEKWERYTGQTWKEYGGKMWTEGLHPDDRGKIKEQWVEAVREKKVLMSEGRIKKADGEYAYFKSIARPLLDDQGTVKEWVGTISDITESKKYKDRIVENEVMLWGLFNKYNIGILICSADKRIIKANGRFCDMVKYSEQELNDMKWIDLLHPEDIEANAALAEEMIERKRDIYELEERFSGKNGEVIYANTNVSCVRDKDGAVKYFLITENDITERKITEKKAEEIARFPEEHPEPILRVSKSGFIEYMNPAAKRIMNSSGFSEGDEIEISWRNNVQRILREGMAWFDDKKFGQRLFSFMFFPVVEAGYVNIYGQEITERRRAEKELTATERRYKLLYETSREPICMLSRELDIIGGNRAFIELFGCKNKEELIGLSVPELSPEYQPNGKLSSEEAQECIRRTEEKGAYFFEWTHKKVTGESFLTKVLLMKVDEDGESFFHATVRDISEERFLQKKLIENEKLASLGKLVADMAHEVNNPLMIVSGRAQISLMEECDEYEKKENLNVIVDQCMRAKEIIQRLLDFSRPSKGLQSEVDINEVVDCVVELLKHQYALLGVNIITDYGKGLSKIKADDKRLHEVFMNVIKNARESMPDGGDITIITGEENGVILVEIRDEGEGIQEENIKKVFDPFFSTKLKGLGLGLSVCYGIIKDHGGEMHFESETGKGSRLLITFPVVNEDRKD